MQHSSLSVVINDFPAIFTFDVLKVGKPFHRTEFKQREKVISFKELCFLKKVPSAAALLETVNQRQTRQQTPSLAFEKRTFILFSKQDAVSSVMYTMKIIGVC